MTNNPRKIVGLEGHGLQVTEPIPLEVRACSENIGYLRVKRDKLLHRLRLEDAATPGEEEQ